MDTLKLHISEEEIQKFHTGQLSSEELIQLLSHTSHCTWCADRLAAEMEETSLYRAPKNFKEAILQKTESFSMDSTLSFKARKRQWIFYSTKICAAALIALLLLFSLPAQDFSAEMPPIEINYQEALPLNFTEKINNTLNSTASNLNQKMNQIFLKQPIKEETYYD